MPAAEIRNLYSQEEKCFKIKRKMFEKKNKINQ